MHIQFCTNVLKSSSSNTPIAIPTRINGIPHANADIIKYLNRHRRQRSRERDRDREKERKRERKK